MTLEPSGDPAIGTLISIHGPQGTNYIAVDSGLEESHCGLIPLSERCQSCSTTGLKWNLGILFSSRRDGIEHMSLATTTIFP